MKNRAWIALFLLMTLTACSTASRSPASSDDKKVCDQLVHEILANGQAYSNLKELVSGGSRLSASPAASRAIQWAKGAMESYGFDKVWLQEVMVPHWERGHHEDAVITLGGRGHLRIAALGSSVGTPKDGVEAEVIEVSSLKEATERSLELNGKIVFFNGAMDPALTNTFEAYHQSGSQRGAGPDLAARAGALAVLVRSLTLNHDMHMHTGATWFKEDTKKIPAASIATADADRLSRLLKTEKVRVKLQLSAQNLPPVHSYNVIGELTGREFPDEYIVVGGHLDSWDLGPGAQDDGAGVVQSLEVLRAMKALEIKPRRSLRAVLYIDEEIEASGAKEYAKQAALKKEKHIAAIESDRGGFTPTGFTTDADQRLLQKLSSWEEVLSPLNSDRFVAGEGGTDIGLLKPMKTVQFGLRPDSARYFDYHHSETDTLDAVSARELNLGASAMAVLAYMLSEHGI